VRPNEMAGMADDMAVKATMRPTRKNCCRMRDTLQSVVEMALAVLPAVA
jgi:hypothetical protein